MPRIKAILLAVMIAGLSFHPAQANDRPSDQAALEEVREQLNQNNSQQTKNRLLSSYAAQGNLSAVHYLLEQGAEIDNKDGNQGFTPLFAAILQNHLHMVKLLVSKGADLNILDEEGNSALFFACLSPNPDLARYLVAKGMSIEHQNSRGATPLFFAAAYGNTAMLDFLYSQGANPLVSDKDGDTPLGWAFQIGDIQNVLYLISKGADPKAQNLLGETPMFLAVDENRISLLKDVWLKADNDIFDINHANHAGDTMLHKALRAGNPALASQLYAHNANPLLKNRQGQSAFWTLLDYLEGPVNPATLSTLEAGCAADNCAFWEYLDKTEAVSANLDKVQANMRTLQTIAETYAIDHDGVYAPDLATLYSFASQRKYWKDVLNPFTAQVGLAGSALDYSDPYSDQSPGLEHRGKVVYRALKQQGSIKAYELYGVDHLGRWIKGTDNQPLVFNAS